MWIQTTEAKWRVRVNVRIVLCKPPRGGEAAFDCDQGTSI